MRKENNDDLQFYSVIYDTVVSDWPGEIDFYNKFIRDEVFPKNGTVLELACGTGRVTLRLAENNVSIVGLDLSPEMLEIARKKGESFKNVRWIEADMRSFHLDETFDLILIPAHSFQFMNTPKDQISCLESVYQLLNCGGKLIVHLDHMNDEHMVWLGEISEKKAGNYHLANEFIHPVTGNRVKAFRSWIYHPSRQSAIARTKWEELDSTGNCINRLERGPIQLHCVFRFEMEHLLERVGFKIINVYGDFTQRELEDSSTEMIWIAEKDM